MHEALVVADDVRPTEVDWRADEMQEAEPTLNDRFVGNVSWNECLVFFVCSCMEEGVDECRKKDVDEGVDECMV